MPQAPLVHRLICVTGEPTRWSGDPREADHRTGPPLTLAGRPRENDLNADADAMLALKFLDARAWGNRA
jgi:hypothetical protein